MAELDRRTFLRMGVGVAAGLVSGTILLPVNALVTEGTQQITGQQTGNTQLQETIDAYCKNENLSTEDCFGRTKQMLSDNEVFFSVVAPVSEEVAFRVLPSVALTMMNPEEDPISTILKGNNRVLLSRRELGVGIVSTGIFAAMHSITSKGFEGLPTPSIVAGLSLWALQRKFGFLANTTAHIVNNSLALQIIKNISS